MPVIGPPYTSAPPITHCDWSKTSFCATVTNLDILLISPMTLSQFVNNGEYMYDSHGCFWLENEITSNISGIGLPTPLANSGEIAQHKAIKDFYNCMAESCGCSSPIPWNIYGCMDDGKLNPSYVNNRTTWDFYTMNNTTSQGVVKQPDHTNVPGISWGPRSLNVPGTNSGEAYNYDSLATVDDGSCKYTPFFIAPLGTNMPPNWTPPIPYIRSGCMDSTPHNAADHGFPYGFPDVNGHGTAAVYGCHTASGTNMGALTVPTIGDPCGGGVSCMNAYNNTGYLAEGYDPCANHSCANSDGDFDYSSDINWTYTHHLDDPNSTWNNPTPGMIFPPAPGVGGNPPGLQKWKPFGNTSCCNYKEPEDLRIGLTYDFRCSGRITTGGMHLSNGHTTLLNAQGAPVPALLGNPELRIFCSYWDVVGNRVFGSRAPGNWPSPNDFNHSELYYGVHWPLGHQDYEQQYHFSNGVWPTPETVRIRVYDIYENLVADYDYRWKQVASGGLGTTIPCQGNKFCVWEGASLELVSQNYPPGSGTVVPNLQLYGPQAIDGPPTSTWGTPFFGQDGSSMQINQRDFFSGAVHPIGNPNGMGAGQSPNGYIRFDSKHSGTTEDISSGTPFSSPRIPSQHWVTPRGNTRNLGLDPVTLTPNHWTGNNYRAVNPIHHPAFPAHHNPYPAWDAWMNPAFPAHPWVLHAQGVGWQYPHCCTNCTNHPPSLTQNLSACVPILHWLEPGPNDPTPGNWYYNDPTSTSWIVGSCGSSVQPDFASAAANCPGYIPGPPGPIMSRSNARLASTDQCGGNSVVTKITYNKDKNQDVTITSPSTDIFTPESTQITTPPPTTPIPPPTTPPPTTPPPTTMTDNGGY